MLKQIPSDINNDATPLGFEINQLVILIIVFIAELFFYLGRGQIIKGILIILFTVIPLGIMFREDGFNKLFDFISYHRLSKRETGESISDYSELSEVSVSKNVESIFSEVSPQVNFGALEEGYRERLAMDFAAMTYEMTTHDATIRYISYSSTQSLLPLGEKLRALNDMDHINEKVKEIYRRRISMHSAIADNAVKTNYIVRVDRPLKSDEAWEDMLPMGDVIGPKLIEYHQEKQLTPIPRLIRGGQ